MASDSGCPSSSKRSTKFDNDKIGSQSDSSMSEFASGKRMKTDDSGINIIQDSDVSDDSSDDACLLKSSRKINISSESDHESPSNLETCSVPDLECSGELVVETEPTNDIGSSLAMEDLIEMDERNSASSDDSDLKSEDEIAKEEEEKKFDPTPNRPRPKPNWIAPSVISSRQYGYSTKYSPDLFRYQCSGSLHCVERLELMYKMNKHDGCVNALNFNSTGTKLVSGSDDLIIILWDWSINEPLLEYRSGHTTNVFQAKFIPLSNDSLVVTCARDGQVRLGEISSENVSKGTRKLAQHKGSAHKLVVQADSAHTVLTCGEDAAVFEIDLRKEKAEKLLVCKNKDQKVALYSIFMNPQNSFEFAVAGRCQYAKIYDRRFIQQKEGFIKEYCPEHLVNDNVVNITSLVYNYNGQEILLSYNDDDIYLFDTKQPNTTTYKHRYQGHRNSQTVKGVNFFGSKSEFIMSGSDCGFIFLWEKESEHIVKYMYGDEGGSVNCLEPHPTVPILATSGLDDDIKIWVPSCETMPDLQCLRSHVIRNIKSREQDRTNESADEYMDQTLWMLMQHLTRARRRVRRDMPREDDSDDSSLTSSSEDMDDVNAINTCNQS